MREAEGKGFSQRWSDISSLSKKRRIRYGKGGNKEIKKRNFGNFNGRKFKDNLNSFSSICSKHSKKV